MPNYRFEDLSRRFGRIIAIRGVTFDAAAGEFVVVLGPTGAGKTTLLRVVAGLEKCDHGRVLAGGQDITRLSPPERDIAMVFQNFSLYPRLSVYDNLAFPLRPRWRRIARDEIDRRVKWAAELLGLTGKLDQMPTQLSGGQQQRVAIGRAIVREPKLFLFDEPLASLDAKLREQLAVEIHRLQRRLGVTMLYVTHDQTEAMSLADRIVVLDEGRVLQVGTPDEIYRTPASPRVAQMLGSPPINLLTGAEANQLGLPQAATVGIRPEHVEPVPETSAEPARVLVVEHLGPVTTLLIDFRGIKLRSCVGPGSAIKVGDAINIRVAPEHVLTW